MLDGANYNMVVTWNVYRGGSAAGGGGWYVNIYDQSGALITLRPRVGSPDNFNISLVGGLFTSSLVFRVSTQQFEVSP